MWDAQRDLLSRVPRLQVSGAATWPQRPERGSVLGSESESRGTARALAGTVSWRIRGGNGVERADFRVGAPHLPRALWNCCPTAAAGEFLGMETQSARRAAAPPTLHRCSHFLAV
jgi:hypothetical protein